MISTWHHLLVTYPPPHPQGVPPFTAVAHPVPLPPGHGAVVVTVNNGPYLISAASTSKLKIDGRQVPIAGAGTWHVAVPAGPREVKFTDFMGIPLMSTVVEVPPGAAQHLSFRFGGLRNRVYDGQGADITKFGLWSNYAMGGAVAAVMLVVCCGTVLLASNL